MVSILTIQEQWVFSNAMNTNVCTVMRNRLNIFQRCNKFNK